MDDADESMWANMDDVERNAHEETRDLARRAMLNRYDDPSRRGPEPVEGRIVRPGEPSPGRNQTPRTPEPQGKSLMMNPLEGRPIAGGTYAAFVLDGPAAGKWTVERDHWRAVQMDHHQDAMWHAMRGGRYMDEAISVKQTVYHLQRLAIATRQQDPGNDPDERRQYWFWSSVPVWEMDPAAAVFLLIDAEPWQTQLCRVPDRH